MSQSVNDKVIYWDSGQNSYRVFFFQNSNRVIFFKVHTGWFFSKSLQGDFLKISTGWFFQNSYRVIFWVRSCLLITLIKCLKGHKSLGSLGSVVKGLNVSSVLPTKGPTKGQGHLLSCSGQLKTRFTKETNNVWQYKLNRICLSMMTQTKQLGFHHDSCCVMDRPSPYIINNKTKKQTSS